MFSNVQTNIWKVGQFSIRNKTLFFAYKTIGNVNVKRHDVRHCVDGEFWTTTSEAEAKSVCKQLNTVGK